MLAPGLLARALAELPRTPLRGVGYRVIDYDALHGFHSPTPYVPTPYTAWEPQPST